MLEPIKHIPPFLVRSSDVVWIRDKEHALDLLREQQRSSVFSARDEDEELYQLAQALVDRRVLLVRPPGITPLDPPKYLPLGPRKARPREDEPIQPAPLHDIDGGDPSTHQPDGPSPSGDVVSGDPTTPEPNIVADDVFVLRVDDEDGTHLRFECVIDGQEHSSSGDPVEITGLEPGRALKVTLGEIPL